MLRVCIKFFTIIFLLTYINSAHGLYPVLGRIVFCLSAQQQTAAHRP